MAGGRRAAGLLLAAAWLLQRADSFAISLHAVDNITVTIKRASSVSPPTGCKICVKQVCKYELQITGNERKENYTFSCSAPEKYFVMKIQKNIDCMSGPCPFGDVYLQPSGLPRLNRTFIWDVKASKKVGLELKFSTPWLRQIEPTSTCPDLITYKISSYIDATTVNIGTFCRNGSVSRVKVQGGVVMALQIPWNSPMNLTTSGFNIANRSSIKRLCIIESTFKGPMSATLMSANYPLGFPEDELMTWQFVVPSNLRASVFFRNYSLSICEKKEERVEYYLPGSYGNPEVYKLSEKQPVNIGGSFNLSLQGCDHDDQNPGILRLLFQIVVQHPQNEENVTYSVDLTKEKGLIITIHPKSSYRGAPFVPGCLICKDIRTCEHNVTLTSGNEYELTFLCNDLEHLRITAEKTIACWDLRYCEKKIHALIVPSVIFQLPIWLDKFIWKLLAPEEINVEITSPSLKLQQHVQEHRCNTSYSYSIVSTTKEKELNLGIFCPGGAIEKIQMRDNITISLKTFGRGFVNESLNQDLKMSFVPFIKEECIFTVTPDAKAQVYLQTPNWLDGLPPYVSVSWNITVPSKQVTRLAFSKERMDIACETGRAYVNIKEQRPKAEEIVRREDEMLPEPLRMYHHFWVNISNCKPVNNKQLSLQFWLTFVQQKTDLVVIIAVVIGVAGAVAVVGIIIYCTKKKRKESQNPRVGIYNANVNTRMPGRRDFFKKKRQNNDSHVYAVIDDAMVYGDFQMKSNGSVIPEVDVYRPFDGPMSNIPPTPPPVTFKKATKVSDPGQSPFCSVSDSETYTFAHRTPEETTSTRERHMNSAGDVDVPKLEIKEQEGLEEQLMPK